MRKRRMLRKDELLHNYQLKKHLEKCQCGASFAVAALVTNYLLWKEFNFYPKILAEYNIKTREYWDKFEPGKIDEYNDQIDKSLKLRIEYEKIGNTNKNATNYFRKMHKFLDESNDLINSEFQKYMISSFQALISMGYGKTRMNRLNEQIIEMFNDCTTGAKSTETLRKELEDYGVIIEFPFSGPMNFDEVYAMEMRKETR